MSHSFSPVPSPSRRRARIGPWGVIIFGLALLSIFAAFALSRSALPGGNGPAYAEVGSGEGALGDGAEGKGGQSSVDGEDAYDLTAARLVRKTLARVNDLYMGIDEVTPAMLFEGGLIGLAAEADDALWTPRHGETPSALLVGEQALLLEPERYRRFDELSEAFGQVFAFYLGARELDADDVDIEYATIRGMLRELDHPSRLLVKDRLDSFRIRSRGRLSGVGCRIRMLQDVPTVVGVIEAGPAEKVGLKVDDRIVRVDGESTINMTLKEVVSRIRGPVGTWVALDIKRGASSALMGLRIKRDNIKIDNVQAYKLPGGVGYLRITNFSDQTLSNFRKHIFELAPKGQDLPGLIIDLRGNGGGSLRQSAFMVDQFIGEGSIVMTEGRTAQAVRRLVREIKARPSQLLQKTPLAVLMDRRTASGSEILAGALHFAGRAIILGQRSYGKGSVQKVYKIDPHASLKLTVARYLVLGKYSIQDVGLKPDITLIPLRVSEDSLRFRYPRRERADDDAEEVVPEITRESGDDGTTLFFLDERSEADAELSRVERLWRDFQVRFAAELLSRGGHTSRDMLLKQSLPLIEEVQREQAKKVNAALEHRGIDWSVEIPQGRVAMAAHLIMENDGPIQAGQNASLTLEVTNTGAATLTRLRAESRCKDRIFNGLEFLFGRVAPGETSTWSVPVEIPMGAGPGVRQLAFQFTAYHVNGLPKAEAQLAVMAGGRPHIEVDIDYVVEGPVDTALEPDRQLDVGDTLHLMVKVKNTSDIATGQITVSLRKPTRKGIDLKEARVVLEPLSPGASSEAELSLELKAYETADALDAGTLGVTLRIDDREYHRRFERELDFDVPWSIPIFIRPPRLMLTSSTPMTAVQDELLSITGRVDSARAVKHIAFYRNGQKVHRILPDLLPKQSADGLVFDAGILLDEGANRVEVVAEDMDGLRVRERLWMRHLLPPTEVQPADEIHSE